MVDCLVSACLEPPFLGRLGNNGIGRRDRVSLMSFTRHLEGAGSSAQSSVARSWWWILLHPTCDI